MEGPPLKKKSSSIKPTQSSSSSSRSNAPPPAFNTSTRSTRRNNASDKSVENEEKIEKKHPKLKKEEKSITSASSHPPKKEVKVVVGTSKSVKPSSKSKSNLHKTSSISENDEDLEEENVENVTKRITRSSKTEETQPLKNLKTGRKVTTIAQTNVKENVETLKETLEGLSKLAEELECSTNLKRGRKMKTIEKVEGELQPFEDELLQFNNVNIEKKLRKSTPFKANENNNNYINELPVKLPQLRANPFHKEPKIPSSSAPRELILKSHRPHLAGGMLSLSGNYGADLNDLLWEFVLSIDCPENHSSKNAATCHVCLSRIDSSQSTAILSCPHLFHSTCLEPFESVDSSEPQCPMCLREQTREKERKNREERKRLEEETKTRIKEEEVRLKEEKKEKDNEERLKKTIKKKDSDEKKRLEKIRNEKITNNNNNNKGNARGRKREASASSSVEKEEPSFGKIEGKSRRNRKKHRTSAQY
eukprot:TRINITY_DN2048_c0_g1_i1.p1 TRINITY_DN2048_c0_g1~~TRINITY_DN2048_c0_g1_i1.p1  ORF type:complete len:477 (+),score=184.49 TRINITY_DN2048_c0_g1_i1:399-1829(+)